MARPIKNFTRIPIKIEGNVEYPSLTPAKDGDAGFDLRSRISFELRPGDIKTIPTGFHIAIPKGIVGMVCSRSGLVAKNSIACLNSPGIIDSGYRGEIHATLMNFGDKTMFFVPGDRIAQLLLVSHIMHRTEFVLNEELDETERGKDGFGSTGI